MKKKLSCLDMELALAKHFNPRANVIVPNVSWGMFAHECDLIVLSRAGFAREIEIKVSKKDLIDDARKPHAHDDSKISELWFALPTKLMPHIIHVPARAGIIEVRDDGVCRYHRNAEIHRQYRFSAEERFKIARLGTMRIWTLKRKIKELKESSE